MQVIRGLQLSFLWSLKSLKNQTNIKRIFIIYHNFVTEIYYVYVLYQKQL